MASVFIQSVLVLIIALLVSWWKHAKRPCHNADLPLPPGPTPLPIVAMSSTFPGIRVVDISGDVEEFNFVKVAGSYTSINQPRQIRSTYPFVMLASDFIMDTDLSCSIVMHSAFGATMLKMVYGIELAEDDTEYTHMIESALEGLQKNEGTASPSIAHELFEKKPLLEGDPALQEEDVAKNAVGVAWSRHYILCYAMVLLAMLSHPEVQRKAQAELDAVVGPDRLPDFGDRDSLPYVNAIALECFRWQPVAPLGIPHRSMADDVYNGYSIPGGSMIIPNIWAFTRNGHVRDPEHFNPDRFIKDGRFDPNVKDPRTLIFGFGRRICPGRHLADASLFINVASVLHVYNIGPPLDANGEPIQLEPTATTGFLSYPAPFKCTIKPQSAAARNMVLANWK
ncbi:O-methylsterigmatocystin oxidoreductase [Grifola frondosa]|uniref:O-methylsterigmatocystin oxidoreductase n=1 Tax=Grifola frondosa TaxID=5627 RepID=A0A1C7LYB5_GRIFR|nr:O-methylsterigmatocystin oxidoreductase [Grifola frondosa]